MSTSSADGFVTNVSMTRLCSFWAIVASARPGSRKNRESGYSRWTVARSRLKCFTTNCVRKYRSSGGLRLVAGRVVLHRLGPADVVDPDDQRLDLGVLASRVEVEAEQAQGDEGDEDQRDLAGTCS